MPQSNDVFTSMGASGLSGGTGRFASPWVDLATQYAPKTFNDALKLCEYLYVNNSTYKEASERVVSYFITKIRLQGQSDKEMEKFKKVLDVKFDALGALKDMGEDRMVYGNAFASIIPPFYRMLKCAVCKSTAIKIENIDYKFKFDDLSFTARCPHCNKETRHMVHDYADPNPDRIKLKRWDPKRITIEYNDITGDCRYWLDIEPNMANKITSGDKFIINTTPWGFIQAVQRKQKYEFNKEYLFHMKEGCIAGVQLRGWGLPSILCSFKNFFRLQVLLRYDETLMMDYIVPLRLISPALTTGQPGNDMMSIANMENFRSQFESGIVQHRLDGADWNFFPFAVNYQAIGGEGAKLSQAEAIRNEEDRLLNARGFPPELYRGTLTIQTAATGLRLFERSWQSFVHDLNSALQWMVTSIARLTRSGDMEAALDSVTFSDDIEAKQMRMQLMASNQISRETALETIGLDAESEKEKVMDEIARDRKLETKAQREAEMEQMSLIAPEGEGGEGGGQQANADSATPMDIEAQAQDIAMQLVDPQVTTAVRRQELAKIRAGNPTLYASVSKKIEQMRQQAGTAGRDQMLTQMTQQAGPGGQPPQ